MRSSRNCPRLLNYADPMTVIQPEPTRTNSIPTTLSECVVKSPKRLVNSSNGCGKEREVQLPLASSNKPSLGLHLNFRVMVSKTLKNSSHSSSTVPTKI